ncbi:MAG: ABC transporter ATP-binding protein [Bacillota bacterium]|nr:ABC transporter ATP-binding protein [Bacillota bacterium]
MDEVLHLHGITKRFPGVLANDRVDLGLVRGEIHAILGENGAGKSTLMKIVSGMLEPDEGWIELDGRRVRFASPREAIAAGIGMVYQHFMLIPVFTVAENVVLGAEPGRGLRFDRSEAEREVRALAEQYHMEVDPAARVGDLSVGLQQRVEILKTFYRKARILILDEPTAALTPQEARDLFQVMRGLVQQGISILFISHKLDEVLGVADRITVMRRGRTVATLRPAETDEQELAHLMVGRAVQLVSARPPVERGPVVLQVEELTVRREDGRLGVDGVSFSIHAGEVFGIAGVEGNGQAELVEAVAGLRPVAGGRIRYLGQEVTAWDARRRAMAGIAYVPEDRVGTGLVMGFTLAENLALKRYFLPPLAHRGWLDRRAMWSEAKRRLELYDVRPPEPGLTARALSGGNQQKVILAREVGSDPELLIAYQPTRGLDVGAIEFVHQQILRLRGEGKAILLVSLELDEVLQLSDTVAVMYRGRLAAVLPSEEADRETVGLYMTGGKARAAEPEREEGGRR